MRLILAPFRALAELAVTVWALLHWKKDGE